MADIFAPLLETLNTHPSLSGLITFIVSAGESIAILGTLVPGSITMTAIGALAGAGIIPLWPTLFWAVLGAIVGDGISYWFGHYFKDRLHRMWPFKSHPMLLKSGESFFHKHGSMSVFIGRFVGPVRALVPLVAGMLGMRPFKFLVANITSAILWAPAYMLPGILVGAAAQELPPDIAMHVIMTLVFIVLLGLLCLWFIYKTLQLIHNQTDELKNWMWRKLKKSQYFSVTTVILRHYDEKKTHGQLRLALYFIGFSILFLALSFYVKIKGASTLIVNDAMFHLFRGIRTPDLDNIMLNITLLGQKQIVLPAVFVFFLCLFFYKRWWTAFHALALGILAGGGVYITKHLIHSARPWGILQNPESYSLPSGHTTLATTVFMGLAFLIALSFRPKRRWPIFFAAGIIAFAVGVSRIYLGAHWFTDVVASWLLSAALLIIIIISFRRRAEKPINPLLILLISVISISITFAYYRYTHLEELKTAYSAVEWPTANIAMKEWWEKNNAIPSYRTSLFGFPSQKINIEWAGDIEKIRKDLINEGWSKPPSRDWISTIHRIADISSAQYLPMVSPQYLDKKPALMLTRTFTDEKNNKTLIVIRLWPSSRFINQNEMPLWVGVVGAVPRAYSWLFNHNASDVDIDPAVVFPTKTSIGGWEWKTMYMNQPTATGKMINQEILLIRENKSIHQKK